MLAAARLQAAGLPADMFLGRLSVLRILPVECCQMRTVVCRLQRRQQQQKQKQQHQENVQVRVNACGNSLDCLLWLLSSCHFGGATERMSVCTATSVLHSSALMQQQCKRFASSSDR
jgi:hypothetical protein